MRSQWRSVSDKRRAVTSAGSRTYAASRSARGRSADGGSAAKANGAGSCDGNNRDPGTHRRRRRRGSSSRCNQSKQSNKFHSDRKADFWVALNTCIAGQKLVISQWIRVVSSIPWTGTGPPSALKVSTARAEGWLGFDQNSTCSTCRKRDKETTLCKPTLAPAPVSFRAGRKHNWNQPKKNNRYRLRYFK